VLAWPSWSAAAREDSPGPPISRVTVNNGAGHNT
jgi:hypothetical protein